MKLFWVMLGSVFFGMSIALIRFLLIGIDDPYQIANNPVFPSTVIDYDPYTTFIYSGFDKYEKALQVINLRDLNYSGNILIVVDVSEQREYIFDQEGELINIYTISTGSASVNLGGDNYVNRSMNESVWRVSEKIGYELSPIYGPRLMFLERYLDEVWITTEVALHGTDIPEIIGKPESLGCVYHKNADIIDLYEIVDVGTFVIAID